MRQLRTYGSRSKNFFEILAPDASQSDAQGELCESTAGGAKQKTRGDCLGFVWLPLLDSNQRHPD